MAYRTLKNKGSAFIWVFALSSLFILALVYLSLTQPINSIKAQLEPGTNFTTEQNQTWQFIFNTWVWFPAIMLLGIVLYAVLRTLRSDTGGGYY